MATVVHEIERKYDPAEGAMVALDAVQAMTGTAGVAAVSQQGEQLLDAVYYDIADLRLIGAGQALAEVAADHVSAEPASPPTLYGGATRPNHGPLTG